jgi:hypothetical protein
MSLLVVCCHCCMCWFLFGSTAIVQNNSCHKLYDCVKQEYACNVHHAQLSAVVLLASMALLAAGTCCVLNGRPSSGGTVVVCCSAEAHTSGIVCSAAGCADLHS